MGQRVKGDGLAAVWRELVGHLTWFPATWLEGGYLSLNNFSEIQQLEVQLARSLETGCTEICLQENGYSVSHFCFLCLPQRNDTWPWVLHVVELLDAGGCYG